MRMGVAVGGLNWTGSVGVLMGVTVNGSDVGVMVRVAGEVAVAATVAVAAWLDPAVGDATASVGEG